VPIAPSKRRILSPSNRRRVNSELFNNYSIKKQTRLRTPRSGINALKFGQLISPVAALFHGV
jgi:hypothetical protein